jgi:MoaA/NifB/PqqE/SkfB family radical SAM enzyme
MKTSGEAYKNFELNSRFYFSKALNKPLVGPHWIYISLTNKCPLDCMMCGVKYLNRKTELSTEALKKIILEISRYGGDQSILFTGGEPFLRKDIFELIKYSSSLGLPTEVVSNGQLIDDKLAERIVKSGLQNIAISLDGATAETYESIRLVPGSFEKAKKAIMLLAQKKKKNNGHGPQISAWTTMMKQNIPELYDILLLSKKLGAEVIVYHPVIINQIDMQNTNSKSPLWPDEASLRIFEKQMKQIIEHHNRHGFVAFMHDPSYFLKYFKGQNLHNDWQCNPFEFLNIGPDGNMQTCGDTFGNAREGVNKAWTSDRASAERAIMKRCTKSCLQTCWARPSADSIEKITRTLITDIRKSGIEKKEKQRLLSDALSEIDKFEKMLIENN